MASSEQPGCIASVFGVGWFVFCGFAFVVCSVAGVWSWCSHQQTPDEPKVRTSLADTRNSRHRPILQSVQRVTDALGYPTGTVKIVIADSKDLNAASFGHGVFVFWDGVADLPAQSIDAIAAHEFAHDVLRHSKKTEELQDVTQFFGNLVGLVGGASEGGQQVVSAWIDLASLPKYSRAQEFEADELAVVTLGQMGFPNGEVVFTELLETLQRHYGEAGGGLWDTHPGISERLAKIQQRADKESELGPTSGAPSR